MQAPILEIAVAVLTIAGGLLSIWGRKRVPVGAAAAAQEGGVNYLKAFALVVLAFGVVTVVFYRETLLARSADVLFASWLLIAMVAGMLVQVVASNYRARKRLFDVGRDRLLYPLLFSVVVFYPVWALAASSEPSFFVIHAAFLNGYFWESIVSAAKPPSMT